MDRQTASHLLAGFSAGVVSLLGGVVAYSKYRDAQLLKKQQREEEIKKYFQEKNEKASAHIPTTNPKGYIECSCGMICESEHIYCLHVEHHGRNMKPTDVTGWPEKHLTTVPYVTLAQRAIVSKGDFDHALFMAVKLRPNFDDLGVRVAVSRIPQYTEDVMKALVPHDKTQTVRLVSTVAVQERLWRSWDKNPPAIVPFEELRHTKDPQRVLFPSEPLPGQGDGHYVFLFAKANRADACYELSKTFLTRLADNVETFDRVIGFSYKRGPMNAHDLSGFIDGTRNPDHLLRAIVDEVLIFPDDQQNGRQHTGGAYMYAGKFVHDLKKFAAMSPEDKNNVIGRDYHTVKPHRGYDNRPENPRLDPAPEASHANRAHGNMYRHAYPYVNGAQEGLYFLAFSRSMQDIHQAVLRMAGRLSPDGSPDNLFRMTQAITSSYYYAPSIAELAALTNDEFSFVPAVVSVKVPDSPATSASNDPNRVQVIFEYCTNCGYKTILLEKIQLLKSILPSVEIIENPTMPRLASFEITTADGATLWSKLSQPDGRNNPPHVFPANDKLAINFVKYLKKRKIPIPDDDSTDENNNNTATNKANNLEKPAIYTEKETRVGVW